MTTFVTALPSSSIQSCVARQNLSLEQDNVTLPTGGIIKNYQGNLTLSSASQSVQLQIPSGFTYTLPNVSGALVGRTRTATITNKTIIGGTNGNTVNTTSLNGATISGTASVGNILQATSGSAASWATYTLPSVYSCRVMPLRASDTISNQSNQNVTGGIGGSLLYPGSSVVNIVGFQVYVDASSAIDSTFTLRDITSGLDIATVTVNISGINLFSTTTITNVPTGVARLQVLANRNSTTSLQILQYMINFG